MLYQYLRDILMLNPLKKSCLLVRVYIFYVNAISTYIYTIRYAYTISEKPYQYQQFRNAYI